MLIGQEGADSDGGTVVFAIIEIGVNMRTLDCLLWGSAIETHFCHDLPHTSGTHLCVATERLRLGENRRERYAEGREQRATQRACAIVTRADAVTGIGES